MSLSEAAQQALVFTVDPGSLVPELRDIREYWNAKRGDRPLPNRAEIDPFELRRHLPYLSLLDVLHCDSSDQTDYRFRLIGTGITERFGRDSTGRSIREIYAPGDPDLFEWAIGICDNVVASGRPVLARGTMRAVGKQFSVIEVLNLPFANENGRVDAILSRTAFLEE